MKMSWKKCDLTQDSLFYVFHIDVLIHNTSTRDIFNNEGTKETDMFHYIFLVFILFQEERCYRGGTVGGWRMPRASRESSRL